MGRHWYGPSHLLCWPMPIILHRKLFYVMRHGQTYDNAAGLISGGGRDPDLTDIGRKQALLAAQALSLASPPPTRVIVSGLKRTHQTALLTAPHIPYEIDARLNERHLGELDGLITEEEQKLRKVLPAEESVDAQLARVVEALNTHLEHDAVPLFVAHGGTVRRILEATDLKGKVEAHNAVIYGFAPDQEKWRVFPAIP